MSKKVVFYLFWKMMFDLGYKVLFSVMLVHKNSNTLATLSLSKKKITQRIEKYTEQ